MSVGDLLIEIVIFLIQRLLLPVLPSSIGFVPIETFTATLDGLKENFIYSLSGLDFFIPTGLLLGLILLIIFAEVSLFLFKTGVFIINLVRGSGA